MENLRLPKGKQKGISAVLVKGFKSLSAETYRIPIQPLTLLAGANSSGKSSALQPLLLLKQTLESSPDPGPLLIHDSHVRFTSPDQFFSKTGLNTPPADLAVGVEVNNESSIRSVFRAVDDKLELVETTMEESGQTLTMRADMHSEEIAKLIPPHIDKVRSEFSKSFKRPFHWRVARKRCFFSIELVDEARNSFGVSVPQEAPFDEALRRIIHVPGHRGNPERTYRTTSVEGTFPGTFEPYVASLIQNWQDNDVWRLNQLQEFLKRVGLTWKVKAEPVDSAHARLLVGRLPVARRGGAHDLVSIADVGFGTSQTLPVLVALVAASQGQLVYIEQPEIHLHPRAQIALAEVLAETAERGVRIVVETHSAVILRTIQSLVAEQRLSPQRIAFHWFKRNENGATEISTASVDDKGTYGDWPEDFSEVELTSEQRYLDLVEFRGQ